MKGADFLILAYRSDDQRTTVAASQGIELPKGNAVQLMAIHLRCVKDLGNEASTVRGNIALRLSYRQKTGPATSN